MLKTLEKKRQSGDIYEIYKQQGYKCNEPGCGIHGIYNLTIDHIVPKSIAKLYGWTREMYESRFNKQLLCPIHHMAKDRKNNQRIEKVQYRTQLLLRIKELKYVLN